MTRSNDESKRIESKLEVETYLQNLAYALKNGSARMKFMQERYVDLQREERYTNRFTVGDLFPNDSPERALKRELLTIEAGNYIETVKDLNCPQKSEMRVFGKKYSDDVYIKIRVELLNSGKAGVYDTVFVMSFHYAKYAFTESRFPYRKK